MDEIQEKKQSPESPPDIPQVGNGDHNVVVADDAVFGIIEEDGPNFRDVLHSRC